MTSPKRIFCMLLGLSLAGLTQSSAHAGPLLDWLFGRQQPAYAVGAPVPVGTAPATAYSAGYAPYGYAAQPAPYSAGYAGYGVGSVSNAPIVPAPAFSQPGYANGATISVVPPNPTSLSYVPNFRTNVNRTPVTYYRPVLSTDPVTGAQTTRMAPCTSFEYQAQRVPALGRSALFGSYESPTVVATPSTAPAYTLPSGGVPLNYYTPGVTTRSYGGYTTLPPTQGVVPAGAYQTQPLNSSLYGADPYYGTQSGGCTGNSYAPSTVSPYGATPGLVAPPAPTYAPPAGSYDPTYPGTGSGLGPAPSSVAPSNDPADSPPSLSGTPTRFRPQVRARTVYPESSSAPSTSSSAPSTSSAERTEERRWTPVDDSGSLGSAAPTGVFPPRDEPSRSAPTSEPALRENRSVASEPARLPRSKPSMKPMPVPPDFKVRPWNPSLLREDDLTASAEPNRSNVDWSEVAGTSKQIRWASFPATETEPRQRAVSKPPAPVQRGNFIAQPNEQASSKQPVERAGVQLRSQRQSSQGQLQLSGSMPTTARHPAHHTLTSPNAGEETYSQRRSQRPRLFESSNWKSTGK